MAIQAESTGSFEQVPVGIHNGVLAQVVDCGLVANKFYDPNQKGSRPTNRQIVYVFQLETRKSDGTRFLKEFWFNLSANPKSNIAKFLNSWNGRALSDVELQVNHETLVGKPAQLIISMSQGGKAIITSAAPANPNSALSIEPYDTAEYERLLKERIAKMEETNARVGQAQTQNYASQHSQAQQFAAQNQAFAPQYQQPAPVAPPQYQQPAPQQYQQPTPPPVQQYQQPAQPQQFAQAPPQGAPQQYVPAPPPASHVQPDIPADEIPF